ncbi:Ig-like domain-containing protein, partial [Vibrio lentus]
QVTPSPVNLAKGQTQQLVATATYSDGSSSDVTNSVTWMPIDTAIATVASDGLLSGVEVGSTTLTATKDGVTSNTVDVNVSEAIITDIQVRPSFINIGKGETQQLLATATYSDMTFSDITNSVTWMPIDTAIATVESDGLLSGVEVGSTTLTATKDGVTSNTVDVHVLEVFITAIQVTPLSVILQAGETQQMVATATYSDGSSSDITKSVAWGTSSLNNATISQDGLLTGVSTGKFSLLATKDLVTSNIAHVNVCNLSGPCIDILRTDNGKFFTNSPSVQYLDSTGANITDVIFIEQSGVFYSFNLEQANALCASYNENHLENRTNWRLATEKELREELYERYGDMTKARGWPATDFYWSSTPFDASTYFVVYLNDRTHTDLSVSNTTNKVNYASCVSGRQR